MGCAAGGPRGEYACTAEMIFRDLLFLLDGNGVQWYAI